MHTLNHTQLQCIIQVNNDLVRGHEYVYKLRLLDNKTVCFWEITATPFGRFPKDIEVQAGARGSASRAHKVTLRGQLHVRSPHWASRTVSAWCVWLSNGRPPQTTVVKLLLALLFLRLLLSGVDWWDTLTRTASFNTHADSHCNRI